MEKFAGYGFNKSHAAAYSLLAYHTAWIKVHCTAEFYAANMTVEQDDTDKLQGAARRRQAVRRRLRAARRQPRRAPLRAGRATSSSATAWAPSRAPAQGAIEAIVAAREGRGARTAGRRAVPQPVRLLRARRPQGGQQARRRGADQGRRLRRRCTPTARSAAGQRRPGLRLGRHAGGQCAAGRPVRLRRQRTARATRSRRWWRPNPGASASG